VGGACGTHGRDGKCIKFLSVNVKGKDHSEVLGVNGKIILEWIIGK
jgi:hypothetical protein